MLPKALYEPLPYVCFAIGSLAWVLGESWPVVMLGILLYCISAQLWVWRTHYRRPDRVKANLVDKTRTQRLKPAYRRWAWPFALYEAMPFVYIAIGYGITHLIIDGGPFALTSAGGELFLLSALAFLLTGLTVSALRGYHRLAPARTDG